MKQLMLIISLMLGACDNGTPAPVVATPPKEGREETKGIRNTDAIGLPGGPIADRVDKTLDAQEQHQQQMEQALPE